MPMVFLYRCHQNINSSFRGETTALSHIPFPDLGSIQYLLGGALAGHLRGVDQGIIQIHHQDQLSTLVEFVLMSPHQTF